jgi:tetratricopeptide (TPR) repeat protein
VEKYPSMMESSLTTVFRHALLAALILLAPGFAQGQPEEVGNEALPIETEGYGLIYDYDFDAADALFQRLVDRFPDHAAGPYGRAATVYMRIAQKTGAMRGSSHRGDRFWEQTSKPDVSPEDQAVFDEGYAEAVARAERVLARDPDNTLALYHLGAAESLKAAWEFTISRSYFGGSRTMRRAVRNHRRVVEIDPDYVDAYQVLGVQEYGIATLPRALRFIARLFGMRGEKERGIEWIARTAHEGNRSRWGALWSYQLFMQREDRLAEALDAVRTLREKFPRNPDFSLEEAGIHLHHGETAEAREELLAFIEQRDAGFGNFHLSPGGLAELRLGETWLFEDHWEEAEAAFSEGLQSSPPPDVRVMLHLRRGNARDGLGQRQAALFAYKRVRQLGGDKVAENWAKALRKRPWPEGAPEGSRPHPEGEESHPH